MFSKIEYYYQLTKPGIIRGNAIAAVAGFFLASQGIFDLGLFIATLTGLSLIIASACVFNNYLDQDIDKQMDRTKNRAIVSGAISNRSALIFASIIGLAGSIILIFYVNELSTYLALFGMFAYVVVYGIAKRKTVYGTLVGSISGAVPPVVGYTAVSNNIDIVAILLFIILITWQMPHFYGIALYRMKDYKSASIPVMPLIKGVLATKIQTTIYIAAFAAAASSLTFFGPLSYVYLAVVVSISALWLRTALSGFKDQSAKLWGRKVFRFSLIVMLVLCLSISIDASLS